MTKVKLSINLFGGFSITDGKGLDLTPRATKTQALVALLATSKHYRRSRAWLQDHLWSDREAEQASGSLRQTLHDLRKTLGDASIVVEATRSVITLDADLIEISPMHDGPATEAEFLAGMDVRDPEFNDWMRAMRAHYEAQNVATVAEDSTKSQLWTPSAAIEKPAPIQVRIIAEGHGNPDNVILETVLIEAIQRSLNEGFDVQFSYDLPDKAFQGSKIDTGLVLRVQGLTNQIGEQHVRASLEDLTGLRSFWGETVRIAENEGAGPESFSCQSLAHRATVAFAELLMEDQGLAQSLAASDADMMAASALRKMFTMRPEEVAEAGVLLQAAVERQNRGLYHAWLAQVHCIQHVEQQSSDSDALREQTDAHVRYALELEPMNSNVLAATANARLIFDNDTIQSGALARQSVTLNRSNPLCWFAWANANLYGGSLETAYAAAVTAQALGARSSIEFWTSFQQALSAAVTGRLSEAMSYASVSNALAPNFRPPLRYLAGIASQLGRMPDASRALTRLSSLEEEFSVERMVNDPSYPVSMMRRAKLLQPDKLTDLL